MKKDSKSKWCPLKEGPAVVGKIWPAWDAEERFGNLITTLWSRVVPMRSRFAIIQGRYPDLRDALLDGRRKGPPGGNFPESYRVLSASSACSTHAALPSTQYRIAIFPPV